MINKGIINQLNKSQINHAINDKYIILNDKELVKIHFTKREIYKMYYNRLTKTQLSNS